MSNILYAEYFMNQYESFWLDATLSYINGICLLVSGTAYCMPNITKWISDIPCLLCLPNAQYQQSYMLASARSVRISWLIWPIVVNMICLIWNSTTWDSRFILIIFGVVHRYVESFYDISKSISVWYLVFSFNVDTKLFAGKLMAWKQTTKDSQHNAKITRVQLRSDMHSRTTPHPLSSYPRFTRTNYKVPIVGISVKNDCTRLLSIS